jgi:hypothetical protein
MIVAIPNSTGVQNFGLVDVTTQSMKLFRSQIQDLCEPKTFENYGMSKSLSANSAKLLKVNEVGNYDISVAPSLEALEHNINWNHFKLPKDFEKRKMTLMDKNLFPFNCAYVVAKARKNIKDDGFGIIYPDPLINYFPTCHEYSTNNTPQTGAQYDVKCYNICEKTLQVLPFDQVDGERSLNVENFRDGLNEILGYLDKVCIMSKCGKAKTYSLDMKDKTYTCNFIDIHGRFKNQNIMYQVGSTYM